MLWVFDRLLRAARIIWNNRLWAMGESKYSSATVELVSSDTIRLTLARRFDWRPGQHAYIIVPSISKLPFEAHPFTIASIPAQPRIDNASDSKDNAVVFLIRGRSGMTGRLRRFATRQNNSTVTIPALVDGPYGCPPDLLTFSTSILIAGG
jgi:predicted ferric reductase